MDYVSCNWLQHGLSFETDHIQMCCLCCHEGGGRLHIKDDFNGKNTNWQEILELKKKFIEDNKNGIIDPRCKGCFNLQRKEWDDEEPYINYIHFNHWTKCNSNCVYCYTWYDKKGYNTKPHYKVLPMIKEMFKQKLFRSTGEITFAGGEPTVLDEFDDLITFMMKNGANNIKIHSSGIKYSKGIEKGIKQKKLNVVLSADSGTREIFKQVKGGCDKFDTFWQNVKKYASYQDKDDRNYVATKFILIPEVNTNIEEIDKWFALNIKSGVESIVIDIENNWCMKQREENASTPEYLVELCRYIVKKAKELHFHLMDYNNFRYLITQYDIKLD